MLAKFKDNVFVPKHVGEAHRRLLWKPTAAERLRNETITVNLGNGIDENYRLKPLNSKDEPKTRDLKTVVRLMKTDEDYKNFVPFFVGMHEAGRHIRLEEWEWVTRHLGQAGYQHILVACAKQAKKTGYSLAPHSVARGFFQNFHTAAVACEFKGEELERILKSAVLCTFLFNQEEHTPRGTLSPQRLPDIIGVLLELSAARSIDAFEAKDFDDNIVHGYAEKLLSTWDLVPTEVPSYASAANGTIMEMLPTWNGINLALKVDSIQADSAMQNKLVSRKKELEEKLDVSIEKVRNSTPEGKKRLGLMAADALGYKK